LSKKARKVKVKTVKKAPAKKLFKKTAKKATAKRAMRKAKAANKKAVKSTRKNVKKTVNRTRKNIKMAGEGTYCKITIYDDDSSPDNVYTGCTLGEYQEDTCKGWVELE